ncbi:sugar ABC transporter substrate-binding protein [Ensifer adhaerens]|uniref:sugar ABC transporter substrate-binding protein n=1 Tax=Ensifer adhaerens TaxID=106592 RepID=UPI001CBD5CF5|nr:sugar ABC transporter substrate-binding protein [Ensifer adhaerens]MBZ7924224.1 sugar ABC transporter substrate-binding protein [Ensifer adhaerens]UAX96522.1 sugar ABC transporter substrate-binding protein [Ensifer adhaerens]UAY04134.1 sugar ABC transporter substrate-binding protein [Ensifer adhaerens]UAY12120.1 sugar ABC transporter substrate-binding protein [Ensifer adhaerens]
MKTAVLAACLVLAATSVWAQDSNEIAVFTKNKVDPFFEEARYGAETNATALGLKAVQYAPTQPNNFQEQISEVEDAIVRKPRGMLFVPVDTQGLKPSVAKVKKSGIPIVNFIDKGVGDYDGFVVYDDRKLGRDVTEVMAKAMNGKGNVIIIEGIKGSPTSDNRTAGALEALKNYPDIKVLAIQPANYQRGQALQVTENLLQQFPDINGVVGDSDNMALAALEAFASAGRPQPFVVSMDGTVDGVNSVRDGGLLAVTEFSGFTMGCIGVEMLDKLSKGEKVKNDITLEAPVITKANADGFGQPLKERKCKTIADLGY